MSIDITPLEQFLTVTKKYELRYRNHGYRILAEGKIYFVFNSSISNAFQSFSADVSAAVPGYIIGGNAYFAIPWAFGTIVGLGALALETTPLWPTYPNVRTK